MSSSRQYQNEKPSSVDSFGGQGHQQVANAISDVILLDNNQNIIGIEGELGAGKSTVIELVKLQIETNNCHMVTFDADQYHTSLRSALINTINNDLQSSFSKNKYFKRKEVILQEAVDKALGKQLTYKRSVNSRMPPKTVWFILLLVMSSALGKTAISFISELISEKTPTLDLFIGWTITGLFMSPLIMASCVALHGLFNKKVNVSDLLNRNGCDTINEVLDITREVGAVELKEAFTVFVDVTPNDKTLVLVIDNIDRLSPDIARELWSDIEVLTSIKNNKLLIILPYSLQHLSKALEKVLSMKNNLAVNSFLNESLYNFLHLQS